jgi:hypothetical protein
MFTENGILDGSFSNASLIPPGGTHSEGHRANSRRFTSIMATGYNWVRKRLNGPGAMNYAFDSLALAESSPIGPAVRQRQFWATVSPPLFVNALGRPTSGFGGVVQGQYISQPLFDPYNNTYGNIQGPQ